MTMFIVTVWGEFEKMDTAQRIEVVCLKGIFLLGFNTGILRGGYTSNIISEYGYEVC